MIRASPCEHERPREHRPLFVEDVHHRFGNEDRPRILDEGDYGDLPLLAVRLAQPPDYAVGVRLFSTPAFLRSERTVSVGIAPFSSQARASAALTLITAGFARGL